MRENLSKAKRIDNGEWGVAGWVTHEANSIDRQYIDEFDLKHYEVVGNIFDGGANGKNPKKD